MSLRDVERAMIVFIYFFEKMYLLRDLINEKEMELKVYIKHYIHTHAIFCMFGG